MNELGFFFKETYVEVIRKKQNDLSIPRLNN